MSISVIIPCYNSSQTLERALTSISAQTITAHDIIVVDDNSQDLIETENLIAKLNKTKLRLLKHRTNKNGSAARNTGIKAATGDIIALLDADDEWLPTHIEASVAYLSKENKAIAYSKSIIKSNGLLDIEIPTAGKSDNQSVGDYLFVKQGFIPTPTIVFHKEKVKVLFNEHLIRHQDYDFLLQVEAAGHRIGMSLHTGVIIHWENNNPAAKGGTWEYSLKWAKNNKGLLGTKAFANFLHKHCITPLLIQKKRTKALNLFFTNAVFLYLPLKQWAFFISYLIWGRVVFSRIKK